MLFLKTGSIKKSISKLFRVELVDLFNSVAFTLIELMIAIAILATLASIAIPYYLDILDRARITVAVADIKNIQDAIDLYYEEHGELPESLDALRRNQDRSISMPIPTLDPWGHPYQYADYNRIPKGKRRKNRFMVPINTTYDLYSMGKDGKSQSPLTAQASRDDIIRAYDGAFIGPASEYL